MMMITIFVGGLLLGGFLGVAFMCLLFAAGEEKREVEEENEKDHGEISEM